jgi:hypothetical protein
MRIDERLNLVIPVKRDGPTIYVHSMPISREVFEANFMLISKAFSAIYSEGLTVIAGPRVAAMLIRHIASEMGIWENSKTGEPGAGKSFLEEIKRLTNVAVPNEKGWGMIPLQVAIDQNLLSPDELSEVMGAVCFFTLNSSMMRSSEILQTLEGMESLWGTQTTSSNITAFIASLEMSTEAATLPKPTAGSSVPS